MRQKLPTILILMVMGLVGAVYWVDLCYYTDPVSGFVLHGPVWVRYLAVALPVAMCLLGLRTVGPRALSVMRVKNIRLGVCFIVAAISGVGFGATQLLVSIVPFNAYRLVLGVLMLWYGVWMLLASIQLITQYVPSPTTSAFWGVLAALPYAVITVQRILINPSSLYRVRPLVSSVGALVVMLWFGMLLRSMYIALPRRRVRWLYLMGMLAFLFATCLELPSAVFSAMFSERGGQPLELFESVNMALLGLVAGQVSVSVAACSESGSPPGAKG